MMKTIYLRAKILANLIEDIRQVIKNYSEQIESEDNGIYCHYIGDIMLDDNSMVGAYHANLLVPEGFDASIFKTQIQTPNSPVHQFA